MRESLGGDFHQRIEALLEQIEERPPEVRSPPQRSEAQARVGEELPTERPFRSRQRTDVTAAVEPAPRWPHSPSLDELFAQFHQQAREAAPPAPPREPRAPEPAPEPEPRSPALEEMFAQLEKPAPEPPPAAPALLPPVESDRDPAAMARDRDLIDAASGALYRVRPSPLGRGLFACRAIAAQTRLFGEDDWADEAERKVFSILTPPQIANLTERLRTIFLVYAYNVDITRVSGTFHPEGVRHPTNFMNHSCEPNAGYDGAGNIVALRNIAPDEEIRMDYGTYSFSFDHEFTCTCGALWCRGRVTRDDWRALVLTGLRLPEFMREHTKQALWG